MRPLPPGCSESSAPQRPAGTLVPDLLSASASPHKSTDSDGAPDNPERVNTSPSIHARWPACLHLELMSQYNNEASSETCRRTLRVIISGV